MKTTTTKGRTSFTAKEDQFIKDNYLTMPIKTMAKQIGRSGCGSCHDEMFSLGAGFVAANN